MWCTYAVFSAAIPIGAHEPAWFMKEQHCSPAEAMTIHKELGAKRSFAVHWVSAVRPLCHLFWLQDRQTHALGRSAVRGG